VSAKCCVHNKILGNLGHKSSSSTSRMNFETHRYRPKIRSAKIYSKIHTETIWAIQARPNSNLFNSRESAVLPSSAGSAGPRKLLRGVSDHVLTTGGPDGLRSVIVETFQPSKFVPSHSHLSFEFYFKLAAQFKTSFLAQNVFRIYEEMLPPRWKPFTTYQRACAKAGPTVPQEVDNAV
jgi:anti-sigma factor ChrR (cupin superfamily)